MGFEFVPFAQAEPASGEELSLEVANPDHEAELAAYLDARTRNPFAESHALESMPPGMFEDPHALLAADELYLPYPAVRLVVGYPFRGRYTVVVTSDAPGGFTRAELYRRIVSVHQAMFEDAHFGPAPVKLNTKVESSRFGTAWHRLEDLVIEHVFVEPRGNTALVWIFLGS